MKISDMWKSSFALKVMLIIISLMISSFGDVIWRPLGILLLLGCCYIAYVQGKGQGHAACSVSKSVAHVMEDPEKRAKIDKSLLAQAWSIETGLKGMFAGALTGYVINCIYIVVMLAKVEALIMPMRLASFAVTAPYWPLVSTWYDSYQTLGTGIVAVLMVGPFILPLCQFAGYRCGPKLWAKTEEAMAKGKRRARARSRIVRKNRSRVDKPEI